MKTICRVAPILVLALAGLVIAQQPDRVNQDVRQSVTYYSAAGSWLGLGLADLTPATVTSLHAPSDDGVEVVEVYADSPAAAAGFKPQDVITSYRGEKVESVREFTRLVNETPADRTVPIVVSRDGKQVTLEAHVTERRMRLGTGVGRGVGNGVYRFEYMPDMPAMPAVAPMPPMPPMPAMPAMPSMPAMAPMPPLASVRGFIRVESDHLGLSFENLTPQLATYFGVPDGQSGMLIRSVAADSVGAKAGFEAGDVLTQWAGQDATMNTIMRARTNQAGTTVAATILRHGKSMTLQVAIPERPAGVTE
ncbi:MAG TPA: PDZ domain-containing protein [Terriglobales bacterium]|nr:PDZ domain-containing protein [Terriglobales bacterium]